MKAQATTWTQLMQATAPARAAVRPEREDRAFRLADARDDAPVTRRTEAKAPAARCNGPPAPSRRDEAAPRAENDGGRAAARDAATTAAAEDPVRDRAIGDRAGQGSPAENKADKAATEKAGDDKPGPRHEPGEATASQAAKAEQPAAQGGTKGDAVPPTAGPPTAGPAGFQAQGEIASLAGGRPPAPDEAPASPSAAVGSAGASSTGVRQAAAGAPGLQAATAGARSVPLSDATDGGAGHGASTDAGAFASLVADTIGSAGAGADGSATTLLALQPAEGTKAGPVAATVQTARAAESATASTSLGAVPIEIGLRALAGSSRFDIRLDPAELGRIDVRLDIDKAHGAVKAHLTVERPETLALLQRDAGRLEEALTQAGLTTADGAINVSLRDPSQGGRQDGSAPQDGAPSFGTTGPSGEADTREQAPAASSRIRLRPAGIDIRI